VKTDDLPQRQITDRQQAKEGVDPSRVGDRKTEPTATLALPQPGRRHHLVHRTRAGD
jgi:hypothetical protein